MKTNTNSDTPRTDAAECELHQTWTGSSMRKALYGGWVDSDLAREMERELAEADRIVTIAANELAALRRDKERLDWLEANASCITSTEKNEDGLFAPLTHYSARAKEESGLTVRAAIDAAMEGKK